VSVLTGFALMATVPIALADGASRPRSQAAELRAGAASLDKRATNATLELYALETELRRAQGDVDALAARRAQVARDRAATQKQLEVANQAVLSSESQLAVLVRALYERPDQADPLAVLLSAESLDEALAGLDSLSRVAGENNRIIEQVRGTRTKLAALGARLAEQEDELNRLAAAAEQHAAELAATAAARMSFVTGLRQKQGLTAARLAAVEAGTAEKRTASMSAPEPTPPVAIAENGPRTITVTATGYTLRGRTSTGIRTGPGVVAVDPSVIPLGTRLTIPGYGTGVAADTGGAMRGNVIDLWFPTTQQAHAWGRRTVTVTIS
jgi:3D (Asp-Asp-Asp) domain-containing protein/peptidoglycan hydrolase CwlO-like protein